MAEIDIHVPDDLHSELLTLLFVVYWGAPNYAVKFLHEKAPIAPFKHGEARIVKALRHCLRWLFLEFNQEVGFPFNEILNVIEVKVGGLARLLLILFRRLEDPLEAPNLRLVLLTFIRWKDSDVEVDEACIDHDPFEHLEHGPPLLVLQIVAIGKQVLGLDLV